MEDFSKYEECHPRDFSEVLADFDFDALLSKYGPEGLWAIGNKMREVALEDVQLATKSWRKTNNAQNPKPRRSCFN